MLGRTRKEREKCEKDIDTKRYTGRNKYKRIRRREGRKRGNTESEKLIMWRVRKDRKK